MQKASETVQTPLSKKNLGERYKGVSPVMLAIEQLKNHRLDNSYFYCFYNPKVEYQSEMHLMKAISSAVLVSKYLIPFLSSSDPAPDPDGHCSCS
jgi:hypothetical protein